METQVGIRKFSPINVIASLLVFMPREFNNDPRIIHATIAKLKQNARYKDLFEEFDFLEYDPYPYSPLLGRTLNRLQESRLLSSLNPSYEKYVITEESKEAIRDQILNVKLADQIEKLREIASELEKALS